MRLLITSLLVVLIFTGSAPAQVRRSGAQKTTSTAAVYACPMHPDVTSTKPGHCRKCGMELRLVKAEDKPAPAAVDPDPGPSTSFSSAKIPDVRVYDQNGKQLNFYNDLVKGKTVAINFIFTTCTTICPPLTATFRRVQQNAIERKLDVQLISISVDPTVDTPERLRDFAEKFKAGPGWTFVTGDKTEIDSLLRGLGVAVADKNDHTPTIMIGNDKVDYWTRAYGLASPSTLLELIAGAANRK